MRSPYRRRSAGRREFREIVEDELQIVGKNRALGMAGKLHTLPGRESPEDLRDLPRFAVFEKSDGIAKIHLAFLGKAPEIGDLPLDFGDRQFKIETESVVHAVYLPPHPRQANPVSKVVRAVILQVRHTPRLTRRTASMFSGYPAESFDNIWSTRRSSAAGTFAPALRMESGGSRRCFNSISSRSTAMNGGRPTRRS